MVEPASRWALMPTALAVVVALTLLPSCPASGQEPVPLIRVTGTTVSADTILLGDRFQLRIDARLAPGAVAFVPDSLTGRGFEPFGPVEWSVATASDGGTELSLTYPLIAFALGTVQTPEFELFAASASQSEAAGLTRPGQAIGDFDAFVDNVALVPSARLTPVPARAIEVASVLTTGEVTEMIAPRPPADVAGGDRNWLATLTTLLFGGVFLSVSTVTLREWAAARAAEAAAAGPSPRDVALRSLDHLLEAGPPVEAHLREYFTRSSEVSRRFVEGFDDAWGPAWTGTELMDGLTRRGAHGTPDPAPLRREIEVAERVKFGGQRPGSGDAVAHVEHLREWIASVPEPDPEPES